MRKTKKLVREKAMEYIAEIQRRLPGVSATYNPAENYDLFDGVIRVRGPYDEADDAERIRAVDMLAIDFNEWYRVDFLVLYEQVEPAHTPV